VKRTHPADGTTLLPGVEPTGRALRSRPPLKHSEGARGSKENRPSTGVILAGGKSSRLGVDKALLQLDGGPSLIARTVARLLPLVEEIVIVADDGERFGALPARIVPDLYPGAGSLGGIYTGVAAAANEYSLVVACDMPFLSAAVLYHLLAEPRSFDVLLPRLAGGLTEPLHALYSRACLSPIRRQLEAGRYRIVSFMDEVTVRYVEEPILRRFDPDLRSFVNINTPEELEAAVVMLNGSHSAPELGRPMTLVGG
jgi:molybdopterin-guanine dinucleotide biosynthesis protein A